MISEGDSIRALKTLWADKPGPLAGLSMTLATNHSARQEALEMAIDSFIYDYVQNRELKQDRGEDEVTSDCILALKSMGFLADHDTKVGGHCDIVVKGSDKFLWLGEAKVHRTYDWLEKGLQQLLSRYSTGLPGQQYGGVLIYCFGKNAAEVMRKWIDKVTGMHKPKTTEDHIDKELYFRSTHEHQGTGLPFEVRHSILPLHFEPQDKN